jgi:hypothetical protein
MRPERVVLILAIGADGVINVGEVAHVKPKDKAVLKIRRGSFRCHGSTFWCGSLITDCGVADNVLFAHQLDEFLSQGWLEAGHFSLG